MLVYVALVRVLGDDNALIPFGSRVFRHKSDAFKFAKQINDNSAETHQWCSVSAHTIE